MKTEHHSWAGRNKYIIPFLQKNSSIIDFGCGNKNILDFYTPKKYFGIDINPNADLIIDLNNYNQDYSGYDYALVLGVLEYLDKPFEFLRKIKNSADTFIILNLCTNKKKKVWKHAFDAKNLNLEYQMIFKNIVHYKTSRYDIFICTNN